MKVLFIGGTGNISTSVSKLAVSKGIDLYLLNRGQRNVKIDNVKTIKGDISKSGEIKNLLKDHDWDVLVNWIAFTTNDIKRDIGLFSGKTKQYIFISSASIYQKPVSHPIITESTPAANPYWEYSQNKIACEELLMHEYRNKNFPITIVRPSHTYDTIIPDALGSGDYTVIDRMKKGKKIIIHGDGTSLWTLTHAEDFAIAFVGLLGHQQSIGHAFHITSDESLTWNQIYEAIADAIGVKVNIVHIASDFICRFDDSQVGNLIGDKANSVIFDNTKIKTFVPGYKATIPFKQGIKKTLAYFDANPAKKVISEQTNKLIDTILNEYEKV